MKLQGKVKSIPVKEVTKGMQVLQKNYICKVLKIEDGWADKKNQSIQLVLIKNESVQSWHTVDELKTLVVEYKDPEVLLFSDRGGECQLPLKYSQWQSAIDNGEVDSDKIVDFEIINRPVDDTSYNNFSTYQIAKTIPQTKRMYSEKEVEEIVFEFCEWRWKEWWI